MIKKITFLFFAIAQAFTLQAQNNELRFNLNEGGSHYIKATLLNQVWLRYTEANPGSAILGNPSSSFSDISLRRTRATVSAVFVDRTFFFIQFGQNNFNLTSPKQLGGFFHDAFGEYYLLEEEKLKVGGGLTIASGLSRFTQPSIASILTGDVPVFAQATTGVVDQFSRRLSFWARGQFSKLDYRLLVSNPFMATTAAYLSDELAINPNFANFAQSSTKMYQGYFFWQFWEKESNLNHFFAGTYLGTKKVLNLGGGFIYQKDAMWKLNESLADTNYYDLKLLAIDIFMDLPLRKEGSAITAYAAFFCNDYGHNYIRNVGVNNVFTGTTGSGSFAGAGNAFPMMGTGNVFYTQAGYLFPKGVFNNEKRGAIQPYADLMYANYDALADPMVVYNLGLNYLISGHTSKISLNYQNRPVFNVRNDSQLHAIDRRGMYFLQFQLSI